MHNSQSSHISNKKPESSMILVFDIDDTLIYSNANIKVVKDGCVVKELPPAEYNTYDLQIGESYDYSNFDSYALLKVAKLSPYWDFFKKEYEKGQNIAILTARSRPAMVKKFFEIHGVNLNSDMIFCCGYSKFRWSGKIHEKKAKVINHLVSLGYKTLVFYDDSLTNLNAVKKMEKLYQDVKIIPKLVTLSKNC